jgi:hypothetical protein
MDWRKKPRRRRIFVPGGRYSPFDIGRRVENRRRDLGVTVAELCAVLDFDKADWSRKWRCSGSSFTIAEVSVIADYLKAPVGWPFIPEEMAELLERMTPRQAAAPARK